MSAGGFNDPLLFDQRPLDNHLAGLRNRAVDDAKALGPDALLDSSDDVDVALVEQQVRSLLARHQLAKLVFAFSDKRQTGLNEEDGVFYTSISVPFTGPPELLQLDAGYKAMVSEPLRGNVAVDDDGGQRLVFFVRGPDLDRTLVEVVAERLDRLRAASDWTNELVELWNQGLVEPLRTAATKRARVLGRIAKANASATIPLIATPNPAVPIPIVPQELPPPRHDDSAPSSRPRGSVLADQIYEEVLRVLVLFASAAGRLPSSAGKLYEHDFRNFALIVLNANFHLSAARGEVFNGRGKTDLLVPWEGENAFVGEVKRFDGAQSVTNALSQLLGYVTWVDTKAALIVLVDRRDTTGALDEVDGAVRSHPKFLRADPTHSSDQRRDYVVRSNHDDLREVRLAVIPIVIVEPTTETPPVVRGAGEP